MTTFDATIQDAAGNNPVFGDHVEVVRAITGLDEAVTISKAWLTIKSRRTAADVDAELQHAITTSNTAGGQITDDGTGDTDGSVTFRIEDTDYDDLKAGVTYLYDIQLLLSDGEVTTLEMGTVTWVTEITQARS